MFYNTTMKHSFEKGYFFCIFGTNLSKIIEQILSFCLDSAVSPVLSLLSGWGSTVFVKHKSSILNILVSLVYAFTLNIQ